MSLSDDEALPPDPEEEPDGALQASVALFRKLREVDGLPPEESVDVLLSMLAAQVAGYQEVFAQNEIPTEDRWQVMMLGQILENAQKARVAQHGLIEMLGGAAKELGGGMVALRLKPEEALDALASIPDDATDPMEILRALVERAENITPPDDEGEKGEDAAPSS